MRLADDPWFMMDEVGSTQDVAATLLTQPDCPSVVYAAHQLDGRGRFKRTWVSERGDSLTYSLIFLEYRGHKEPWLIGMNVAIAVARALDARVQWPNDVVLNGKKVAGVLIEMLPIDAESRTPVVGIGANLNQSSLPSEVRDRGTSMLLERGRRLDPLDVAHEIVRQIRRLPEPTSWSEIADVWVELDETPGKTFKLPSGEVATAIEVNGNGALLCKVGETQRTVLAADAVTP